MQVMLLVTFSAKELVDALNDMIVGTAGCRERARQGESNPWIARLRASRCVRARVCVEFAARPNHRTCRT